MAEGFSSIFENLVWILSKNAPPNCLYSQAETMISLPHLYKWTNGHKTHWQWLRKVSDVKAGEFLMVPFSQNVHLMCAYVFWEHVRVWKKASQRGIVRRHQIEVRELCFEEHRGAGKKTERWRAEELDRGDGRKAGGWLRVVNDFARRSQTALTWSDRVCIDASLSGADKSAMPSPNKKINEIFHIDYSRVHCNN